MKISLKWVFDHIVGDVNTVAIKELVSKFIKTTAEIEEYKEVVLAVDQLALIKIDEIGGNAIVAHIVGHDLSHDKICTLPLRNDCAVGSWYLIECHGDSVQWATIASCGGTKDTLLPAVDADALDNPRKWKDGLELSDYIIEIDNKSINHRPDLWGHRGIAREIAAMYNMSLVSLDNVIVQQEAITVVSEPYSSATALCRAAIDVSNEECRQLSVMALPVITMRPSSLAMIIRLSRLDARSINYVVDATNYVMFDMGHPMHVFDADKLSDKTITVRKAQEKEKITVLDGDNLILTNNDIVIADTHKPVSLAGVTGGLETGVTTSTTSIILEAAHFDSTTIRRTSARYKKRTEASMRFEKGLDAYETSDVIRRYLFLLQSNNMSWNSEAVLMQLGKKCKPTTVQFFHSFIEKKLGIAITTEKIVSILEKLSFGVTHVAQDKEVWYTITPPSFRRTKEDLIPEDIVEEIGRYIGYDAIEAVMPLMRTQASDVSATYTVRTIKRVLSSGLLMRELYCYSFFDDTFLKKLSWTAHKSVAIKNPISEHYTQLVTTLQPNLLKAVSENAVHNKQVRFYEWAKIWSLENGNDSNEKKSLSGIFFDQDITFDFYEAKALLQQFFDEMHMHIEWKKTDREWYPWLSTYEKAELFHEGISIGIAGMIAPALMKEFSDAESVAFIFEIDGDYLINYKRPKVRFVPLQKYPSVKRDVCVSVPLSITAAMIEQIIKDVDNHICAVTLLSFFSKPEWIDQKAMAFHVEMRDNNKTLDHEDVEYIWNNVLARLQKHGATIR